MRSLRQLQRTKFDVGSLTDTTERQKAIAVEAVQSYSQKFVVYVSNYEIFQAISLPTMSVILSDLDSPSSISAVPT